MDNPIVVVSGIKDILVRYENVELTELTALANEYQALRKEAARRLSKCGVFLAAGHTAQAIELAETIPALPNLLRILEFDGLQEWNAVLKKHSLPDPSAFNPRQAQMLEEAYSKPEALESLYNAYDSLRGSGASAAEQIRLLRRLLVLEPENQEWRTQLGVLDAHRKEEIEKTLQVERERISGYEADAMIQELSDLALTSPPAPELAAAAVKLRTELRQRNTRQALENLSARLQAAFDAKNLEETGEILDTLDRIAANEGAPLPETCATAILSARDWHSAAQAEFRRHLTTLEGLLDDHANTRQVRCEIQDIEGSGCQLPSLLRQRATTFLLHQELVEQRQRRAIRVLLVAGALGLAGAIAALLWYKSG